MSSYRSSYKSSSYRLSSINDDTTSTSRTSRRTTGDDDDSSLSVSSYTRRSYNFGGDDTSGGDELTSRSSRLRLSSRYSTDSDLDEGGAGSSSATSRFTSKYKSLLSSGDNDDYSYSSTRNYSRFGSRDESDSVGATTSRVSRYSIDNDDDYGFSSSSTTRRTTRLSYLDEDGGSTGDRRESAYSAYSSRRFTSDYKDSLDDYKVTTPTDEETRSFSAQYSVTELGGDEGGFGGSSGRRSRFTSSSRQSSTLARLDSKDAGQVYEAILDYKPPRSATDEICLKEGQEVVVLSKDKPHKWRVRTRRSKNFIKVEEGFAPSAYLKATNETVDVDAPDVTQETPKDEQAIAKDNKKKKDMIVRELIETEEDLIRDMQFVQRTYIRQSESSITPKEIKAVKDDIFGCFKELLSFHNDVLLKNFQKLSKEPATIGTMFLKLEDDFDKHTTYCKNLPKALAILDENSDVSEFFNNYASKVRDEKTLADHLKLPFQRISDYQLLLKELSKHLSRMEENVDDLEKAVKVIAAIPEKTDRSDVDDEEEKRGNGGAGEASSSGTGARPAASPLPTVLGESSDKLSKMLKNVLQAKDYFDVIESNGKAEERFIFLFKTRMFITEINKNISESQRTYSVKKIVKLPDVEVAPDESNPTVLIIKSKDLSDRSFPIGLKCKSVEQAKTWLDNLTRIPAAEDDEQEKAEEQSFIEQDDLFMNVNASEEVKPPVKVDENNNLAKAKKAATELAEATAAAAASASAASSEPVSTLDSSIASLESSSKSSAGNANAEALEDSTEATTAATDNLRSESLSSVDAPETVGKVIARTASKKMKVSRSTEVPLASLKIAQPLKALTRHVGENAKFECKVDAANLHVQWLKDNKILSGKNYRTSKSNDTYYLELINLAPEDAGLYTIIASNGKESASSSSTLNVLSGDSRPTSPGGSFLPHAPRFKVKLKDTELLEGATVRFEIIVRGLPIPSINIYKDNKPLKEDDHLKVIWQSKEVFEIVIEHVKPEDAGVYRCTAINTEGEDETSGKISVSSDKNVFWGLDANGENGSMTEENSISSPRAGSPAFKWFKDGKEFEASERFQVQFDDQEDNIVLIFQHVKPDDAGIYTCVASTANQKISCSAELNVQGVIKELARPPVAPVIKKELANISISEGESVAILEAQVTGYPKPKINWYKGGEILQASEHYKMLYEDEENYALIIKNVKAEDAGSYRLQASNELGTADTSAELTVLKKPKITQITDKIEVMSNEKLVLEVKYESVPPPKVVWYKGGAEIKESKRVKAVIENDKCQLVINKATSEDAGIYKVMICNDLGKEERNVQVTVNSAPKFMRKFEAVEVWEGEVAIFTAQCSAVPKATLEFYKDAKRVEAGERIKIVEQDKDGNFALKVEKATADDEGKYKCVAKNKYGEEEASAELTIKRKQAVPEFKEKLQDLEVKVGDENVKLEVKVDGEPKPAFKWFHNGEEIKEAQKGVAVVNDDKGSALVISKVAPEDHGVYTCKAVNSEGEVQSTGNLIVQGPPYVVKPLENAETAPDAEVTLTAVIKGNPTPQVKWFQDEKEIKLDSRRTYKYDEASAQYTLTIKKLLTEDVGEYCLEASNAYGKCQTTAKVAIVSKPVFTKVLKNIVCKEMESNVEMVVQLDKMSSQPLVKWFKDDKEILDSNKNVKKVHDKLDNSYKVVILKATEEMVGKWKCVASNDYGSTETAARFDIITKPRFLKGLEDLQVLEGETVSMTVQIAGFPKPEVAFYKDGKDVSAEATIRVKKEMDDIYVLEIENIRIIMSGDFECRIHNEAGEASSHGIITVHGKPKFEKDLAGEVSVNAGDEIALEVFLTGKPTPDVQWFVNGKPTAGTERLLLDSKESLYALKIPSAEVADSAVYHVVAKNEFATVCSQQCNVKVTKHECAPTFSKHIEDAIVVVDDNVRFEAVVSALPPAQVSWCRDGVPLAAAPGKVLISADGNKHVLILKDLKQEDAGVISCKAQNAKGVVTDTANLEVHEPTLPSISGLSDVSAIDGEPLRVEAIVTGFPKPIISWYKEDNFVDEQLISSEPKANRYTLHSPAFTADMAGKYTLTAVNSAGEATESFGVFIGGKKPVFLKELEESIVMSLNKANYKLKIGQSAIFETVVFGVPTPTVTWHKNDQLLQPNHRVTITTVDDEHRLEIKEITKDDVAKISCKAINDFGEAVSVCLLKFLNEPHPPIIKKPLEDVKVEEGEPLTLLCSVDGEPMPAVQWYKDDALVDHGDRLKIASKSDGSASLSIDSAKLDDSGRYEVRAENAKGDASTAANLLVVKPQRPPSFTKPLNEKLKVEFNCPLILEATVFGLPPPKIEWAKDGKPINKACPKAKTTTDDKGDCKLVIEQAKSGDAGSYSIKATNPNGEAISSTVVQVMPEPFAPQVLENLPVKVQVVSGEPLQLHAKISAYPLPTVTWAKDKVPLEESSSSSAEGSKPHITSTPEGDLQLAVDAAKATDAGVYAVTVENSVGSLTISTQVDVLVPSEAAQVLFSKQLPKKVELLEQKPLLLTAKVEGDTAGKEATWLKDGKPIKADEGGAMALKEKDGEYSLKIDKATTGDSGVYALVVRTPSTGELLQTQSEVAVGKTARGPFQVTEALPKAVTLQPGEDLQLSMKLDTASSAPALSPSDVTVYKDDRPLSAEDKDGPKVATTESGAVQLRQEKCTPLDSGVYRIEVRTPDGGSLSSVCHVQVKDDKADGDGDGKKPKFTKQLSAVQVESGQPCRLECAIEGNPSDFTISWFRDGEKIVPNEHYGIVKEPNGTLALLIDSFASKDAGQYSVQVKNNAGEATSAAKASSKGAGVNKDKPAFAEGLTATTVSESSPLILKAKVISGLPFEAKWSMNNQPLVASDRVHFVNLPDGTVMLQIDGATMADAGAYKLEVTNDTGKSESQAKVVVEKKGDDKPMTVLKGLTPVTLIAGEPGFIELKVDSEKEGDIKFLQDGKHLLPTDRVHVQQLPGGVIRLTFDKVNLEDQGDYTALFKNGDGQVQSSCPVTVKSKPMITKQLTSLTVKEGCSAKFEVQVKGNPTPTVTWMKNGVDTGVEKRQMTRLDGKDGTYCLVIDKCSLRDDAEYSVHCSNDLGEVSSTAKLNVIATEKFEECPPTFLQPLQDLTVKKGEPFTLVAKIRAHPAPEIVWRKDGKEIKRSDNILTSFDGTTAQLTVSHADIADFGSYELSVGNSLGKASSSANVTTFKESAPKFTHKLTDTEAQVKMETKLTCRVEGYPEPEIFWLFNGKAIESGVKYSIFKEMDQQILVIFNPTEIDSGNYECRAMNHLGSDRTDATVHFIEKDKKGEAAAFLTKLTDYDVLLGGTARFTACVIGTPKPDLTWFKDGQEIKIDGDKYMMEFKDNGMIHFEVRNVTNADLGKYRCHCSNALGYDNSIAQLNLETVDGLDRADKTHKSKKSQNRAHFADDDLDYKGSGLPVPLPDQPRITKMTDNSLTLIWLPSVPEQPRFPVSYVVEFGKTDDGTWLAYQSGIKDTKCEVSNLEPFQDYNFRIRVENKFGISDPSPSVTAHRSKLKVEHEPKEFKPTDFEVPHKDMEKIAAAPKFLREESSFMYGVCGQPVTLEFWVYGYPEPNITWFCGDVKIEQSTKFSFLQDRNGKVCLFINKMDISDVGTYTCVAKNEHGEERRTIKLLNAEPPVFTRRLEESTVPARNHIRMECAFKGVPEPTVKWFKDYQPLHDTSRISIASSGEQSTLVISDCITRDMGLYSCTVSNAAGSSTTAAYVHVTETEVTYDKYPFSYNKTVKPQNKTIEQFYDLGDEMGRGTQGITYHAVERSSGKSFAAKMMHGMGEMKQFMMAELDVMNQLGSHEKLVQLRDAFASTPHSLSLITDLCGGGPLLDFILKKGQLTENEVAHYIRQLLEGLQYMHYKNIGHFGLTIGDLLLDRMNGPDIQICDFGLACRVVPGMKHYVEYGHPEFVAPEIVSKNSVTYTSDVWSAGIVTYILLTGISPFLAENDRATLHNIQNKKLDLSHDTLKHVSDQGQDFLRKVLDFDPINRLDVKSALNHPWLKLGTQPEGGNQLVIMDRLAEYQNRYKKWYDNASCRRYYRRRPLHSCYTHPSRMIYPPDEQYSPLVSPDREIKKYSKTISPFENIYPPNATESGNFTSESHYQSGPDTYLLQLRDTEFPSRIRRYLRIAATTSPSMNYNLKQSHWGSTLMHTGTVPQVSIKERRKFTDIMDEEITDEMKGFSNRSKPMRLVRELGTSSYAYGQLSALRKEAKSAHGGGGGVEDEANLRAPFFREKLRDVAFRSGEDVTFSCYAVGQPEPSYTWFRNESILIENSRVEVKRTSDGRCQLRVKPGREYDVAVYKCVARNSQGSAVCRARLALGDVPEHVSPPSVKDGSAHSVLLAWPPPKQVGNSPVKYFKLEYRTVDEEGWRTVDGNIKHEYYLVSDLQPETSYQFRLSACNKFGWSAASPPSEIARTLSVAENRAVALPATMQFVCSPQSAEEKDTDDLALFPDLDYSRELNPVPLIKSDFKELYDFKSVIAQGKFSVIARAYVKDGSRATLACKCVLAQSETESGAPQEYEVMKSLAHERIVSLSYANRDSMVFSLAMELLSGLNVLTYLSRKQYYTEDCVSKILCQVLDAIEYLHYRGIALIELQPDNVLVVDDRRLQVKLTDFASARYVASTGSKVTVMANPEFIAPEVIKNEEITLPYADIWSVGVLAYILLSGHSPFKGADAKETAQNVVYVRYMFDRLYPEVTQEAIRFILTVFKLTPHKRPTIEECHESKWLLPNEFMIRKRQLAHFSSARLNAYSEEFFSQKKSTHSRLLDLTGLSE